jgi:hypothetical protein
MGGWCFLLFTKMNAKCNQLLSWQLNLLACERCDKVSNCYFPVSVFCYIKVAVCWKMLKHFLGGFSKCRSSSSFTCLFCGFEIACHYSHLKCRFAMNFHNNSVVMSYFGDSFQPHSVDRIIDISGLYSSSLLLCWMQNVKASNWNHSVLYRHLSLL